MREWETFRWRPNSGIALFKVNPDFATVTLAQDIAHPRLEREHVVSAADREQGRVDRVPIHRP